MPRQFYFTADLAPKDKPEPRPEDISQIGFWAVNYPLAVRKAEHIARLSTVPTVVLKVFEQSQDLN